MRRGSFVQALPPAQPIWGTRPLGLEAGQGVAHGPQLFRPSGLEVSLPIIVEHLYNLTRPSNCSLSLSLIFLILLLLFWQHVHF